MITANGSHGKFFLCRFSTTADQPRHGPTNHQAICVPHKVARACGITMQLSADVSSGNVVAPFPAAFGGAGGDNEARALPAAAQEPSQVKGFKGLASKGSKRSRRKCAAARPHRDQHSHTQNARLPRHGRDPVLRTPRVRTFINFPGSVVRPCGPGLSSRAHRAERQKVRRGRRGSLRMKGWG